MSADGSEDRAGEDDEFIAEYDRSTAADIIEEAEPVSDSTAYAEADTQEDGDAVAGSFAPDIEVVPQLPAPENVVFVALGVYLTILALAETIPGVGVAIETFVAVTVLVAVLTAVCYGILIKTTPDT